MERRIAAIIAADMVGYSRLMEADEEGTLLRQKRHRLELIDPKIVAHGGSVIKLIGDGLIAEFPSVVEAVKCAVEIQQAMEMREAEEPDDRRIRYRLAVNLGDIVFDEGDVFGDGVNIAARLESHAEPGGIVVSGMAHDHLKSKVPVDYEFMGELELKNIAAPVRAFNVVMEASMAPRRKGLRSAQDQNSRPCIAVLPFDNFGPPDQSWFADGMVEDVITALAHQPGFDVIARNTTFSYRGSAIDVSRIGAELGAGYILEGSVRQSSNRIRVTAQLIEAETGKHLWAERYDRQIADVFDVQDELTEAVCGAIIDPIQRVERRRAIAATSRDLSTRQFYWQAWDHYCRMRPEAFVQAKDILARSLELDPNDPDLLSARTFLSVTTVLFGWSPDPSQDIALAQEHALKAVANAPQNAVAQFALSSSSMLAGDWDTCLRSAEIAHEIAPNHAAINFCLGSAHVLYGQNLERALFAFERAIRLSPRDAFSAMHHNNRALTLFMMRRDEEALEGWRTAQAIQPDLIWTRFNLAGVLARLGRQEDASKALSHALELRPDPDLDLFRFGWPFRRKADFEQVLEAQRLAGLDI
ncbi:adenylate/guanylate cyclase domain-containing protein [Marimonas sp. MJW-29]|uniref:Adenylate/guanylate cyclase domain-containing protein n=1 Tax=Sulfitobacter sediminis TaxID=3234186 RepID=A0ABV3RSI9_9RHOB